MIQRPFCSGWHDSLQYHAIAGEHVFAARVFWTGSVWHHSMWLYDDGVHEVVNSTAPLAQSSAEFADLTGERFKLHAPDDAVTIEASGERDVSMVLVPRASFDGPSPIGPGLHHPNMRVEICYDGKQLAGDGYCKRYDFRGEPIGYWGYRFVQGFSSERDWAVWTADATFGLEKHAYFRTIEGDDDVTMAADHQSCHRDDHAYGVLEAVDVDVELEQLGLWESRIHSAEMDSLMTQRFCRMTVSAAGRVESGFAINELCFGTLG